MTAQVTWIVLCRICVVPKTVGVDALEMFYYVGASKGITAPSSKTIGQQIAACFWWHVMSGQLSVRTLDPVASSKLNLKITLWEHHIVINLYELTVQLILIQNCNVLHHLILLSIQARYVHAAIHFSSVGKKGTLQKMYTGGIHRWQVTLLQLINYLSFSYSKKHWINIYMMHVVQWYLKLESWLVINFTVGFWKLEADKHFHSFLLAVQTTSMNLKVFKAQCEAQFFISMSISIQIYFFSQFVAL